MTDLTSRPFNPDPEKCCEACIFGGTQHAPFCGSAVDEAPMQSRVLSEPCD